MTSNRFCHLLRSQSVSPFYKGSLSESLFTSIVFSQSSSLVLRVWSEGAFTFSNQEESLLAYVHLNGMRMEFYEHTLKGGILWQGSRGR